MKNLLRHLAGIYVAGRLRRRSQPFALPDGPVLVVAPHADDETLGCGGLLAALDVPGGRRRVVFVTDSAGSPEAGPPAGQAAERRGEALAALAVLGMGPAEARFLDAPDGGLNRLAPVEAARVHTALVAELREFQPVEVFMPFFGGGSSEHDATATLTRAAVAAAGIRCRLWEYPIWAWWDPRRLAGQVTRPDQNHRFALGPVRERKRRALACHASQTTIRPPRRTPELPPVLATLCTGPDEFYFLRQP